MKKMLSVICAVFLTLPAVAVQYYVSGNGTTGNPWCDGKSWGVTACAMTMSDNTGSITFAGVPAGAYQFKVTNGTSWFGMAKFRSSCSNLYAYGNDNICFNTQAQQDITISYDGTYICLAGTVGNEYPDTTQYGAVGVPSEYEGVMMQIFYWNSYQDQGYGRTKWIDLIKIADEIGDNFDLVWFPPSAEGGGTGYYAKRYSIQDSDWGTRTKLQELIDKLHAKGTKAIGDIVVNHHASSNSWCAFFNENFGSYGQFQLTSEHICSGDECFSDKDSNCKGSTERGAADTGDNDAGCRDLDHTSEFVQNLVKAYLSWMRNIIGYDGWRYDMVKGYLGSYLSMYNQSSQPYFSVAEYWDGTPGNLRSYLESASYNTTVFDFPLKYKFNANIGKGSYAGMKNAGLRSIGLQKYAVTFIDNHDTFERSDNQSDEFIGYKKNLVANKPKILQANAYLLMMPGTPCVFFPHWVTFKSEINTLIALRKAAGIHSESQVYDEVGEAKAYSGTVQGHNGSVILRMGSGRDQSVPAGYFRAIQGNDFDIYASNDVVFSPVNITANEHVLAEPNNSEKQIINGHLYIRKNGCTYDATGRLIR